LVLETQYVDGQTHDYVILIRELFFTKTKLTARRFGNLKIGVRLKRKISLISD
jgi:hypothetical protein